MSGLMGGGANAPRKVLIGILQADTGGAFFQVKVNDERIGLVTRAITKLAERTREAKCDFGIFLAPEYLFSNKNSGQPIGLANSGKYYARGISEDQKERNLKNLLIRSKLHPNLILVPGTMAWLKPFDREKGINRHKSVTKLRNNPGQVPHDRRGNAKLDLKSALQASKNHPLTPMGGRGMVGGAGDYGGRSVPNLQQKYDATKNADNILRNSLYFIYRGEIKHKYNKVADYYEDLNWKEQHSVFVPGDAGRQTSMFYGKQLGFEICLDHAYDMLGFGNPTPFAGFVDIHVVLSAAVGNERARVNEGGLFIHASSDYSQTGVQQRKLGAFNLVNESVNLRDMLEKSALDEIFMRYFETEIAIPSLPLA